MEDICYLCLFDSFRLLIKKNWFFIQPLNPPMFLQISQTTTNENIISNELKPSLHDGSIHYPSGKCESQEDSGGYGECVICVDASSEAVCVPCGHVAGCVSCLKEIKNKKLGCPVCRANIDQVIKLYHVWKKKKTEGSYLLCGWKELRMLYTYLIYLILTFFWIQLIKI